MIRDYRVLPGYTLCFSQHKRANSHKNKEPGRRHHPRDYSLLQSDFLYKILKVSVMGMGQSGFGGTILVTGRFTLGCLQLSMKSLSSLEYSESIYIDIYLSVDVHNARDRFRRSFRQSRLRNLMHPKPTGKLRLEHLKKEVGELAARHLPTGLHGFEANVDPCLISPSF